MEHKRELIHKKAQATLEFTVIFVIMVALMASLLGMWKWSVSNIVKRQQSYNGSRLSAGSSSPGVSYGFSPRALTDKDVTYLK
jgi:hypothetical protein